MIYPIRYFGDPVLRRAASPVTEFDKSLATLAADMFETMYDANGVGLAAPQIGLPKRLFVALELAPKNEDEVTGEVEDPDKEVDVNTLTRAEKRAHWGVLAEHVMVNPKIIHREKVQRVQDGCLSLPGLYAEEVERDLRVSVRYQDLTGRALERAAEGHFAHVIQHELDHLDGVLFIDRLPEEERRTFMNTHRRELAGMQRDAKALLKRLRHEPLLTPVGTASR